MADRDLVTDFDGTITAVEFYELVMTHANHRAPGYFVWNRLAEAGKLGFEKAVRFGRALVGQQ